MRVCTIDLNSYLMIVHQTRLALAPEDVVEKPDTKDLLVIRDSKWRGLVDAWETTLSGDRSHTDNGVAMPTEDMLRWLMSLAGVSAAADQHAKRTSSTGLSPDADVSLLPATVRQSLDISNKYARFRRSIHAFLQSSRSQQHRPTILLISTSWAYHLRLCPSAPRNPQMNRRLEQTRE